MHHRAVHHREIHHLSEPGEGRARVALLRTLGPLHAGPPRYDLARLRSLVGTLEPPFDRTL